MTRAQTPSNDTFFLRFLDFAHGLREGCLPATKQDSVLPHRFPTSEWPLGIPFPAHCFTYSRLASFSSVLFHFSKIPEKRQKDDPSPPPAPKEFPEQPFPVFFSFFPFVQLHSGTMGTKIDFPLPRNRKFSSRTHPLFAHQNVPCACSWNYSLIARNYHFSSRTNSGGTPRFQIVH